MVNSPAALRIPAPRHAILDSDEFGIFRGLLAPCYTNWPIVVICNCTPANFPDLMVLSDNDFWNNMLLRSMLPLMPLGRRSAARITRRYALRTNGLSNGDAADKNKQHAEPMASHWITPLAAMP